MSPRRKVKGGTADEPRYIISVAARILGMRTYSLRYYEKIGIIEPLRSSGNIRLYSESDIIRLRRVKSLMENLGINLAGVEVILHMVERMGEMQKQIEELETELNRRNMKSSVRK
jgi:MerR family transcriptional regulator, heat shock protein HspR